MPPVAAPGRLRASRRLETAAATPVLAADPGNVDLCRVDSVIPAQTPRSQPARSGARAPRRGALTVATASLFVAAFAPTPAVAQPDPGERPGEEIRVPRPNVPPPIRPGDDRRQLQTRDGEPIPIRDGGVVRTEGGQPGIVDTSPQPRPFNPEGDAPARATGGPAEPEETAVEDVIEWKTNFEQGIKCRKLPLNARIRLDFNEITLGDLTKFISCVTEQNFILTGGANRAATVSILSPRPVTAYEAYRAYLSALEANGLTVVPSGSFLEIVPAAESRSAGNPIYGPGSAGPNTDQMITRLIQLDHVPAEEILPVLDKFKGKAADISFYAPTNTLIITDSGTNIRRLLRLIEEIDVPVGKARVWIRPVVNTSAAEIVQLLQQIITEPGARGAPTAGAGPTPRPVPQQRGRPPQRPQPPQTPDAGAGQDVQRLTVEKMIPDERTNSIIFVATRTAYLQVDRLIRRLDVPIPGEGSYHVHALENADAEEVAQTLQSLTQGSGGARRAATPQAGAARPQAGAGAPGAPGGAVGLFEGEVRISAYQPTNSLLIESSLKDYLQLKRIIDELDIRRRQVYVEAIIMEISQSKDRTLGISGSGGTVFEVDGEELPLIFGSGGLGLDVQGALSTLQSGGGAIGLQGPMVDVRAGSDQASGGTFSIAAFGFTLRALQTTSNVNVLSTPHILTLENEEAEIQVGRRQPYVTTGLGGGLGGLGGLGALGGLGGLGGAAGGAAGGLGGLGGLGALGGLGGLGGFGRNFQYVDVDLTLKIKPQVNSSGYVRLEIDQQLDDIEGFVGGGAADGGAPITSKRKVNNVVVVRDGQPVVIGGLMRDKETESVSKVPFLGDIPLIGLLFRRTSTQVEKSNLLMIIIPHVITDPSDLKRIYEQRREEYRELARMMAERVKDFEGELDYRKKTGILHDIHAALRKARDERELRERAIFESSEIDRVGPPDTHDIEYDPRDAFDRGERGRDRGGR